MVHDLFAYAPGPGGQPNGWRLPGFPPDLKGTSRQLAEPAGSLAPGTEAWKESAGKVPEP
jgi:hypothetical protein